MSYRENSERFEHIHRLVTAAYREIQDSEDPNDLYHSRVLRERLQRLENLTAKRLHDQGRYSLQYLGEILNVSKQTMHERIKQVASNLASFTFDETTPKL